MSAYQLLLRILPRSFREEFGPEMTAVFEEHRRHLAAPDCGSRTSAR
ncbi:MAG TPA: hypothetical protein VNT81_14685 [Vicinamibacterales bacterium]|nr:hypothetical protein [Vicinamibacterales bacterium]